MILICPLSRKVLKGQIKVLKRRINICPLYRNKRDNKFKGRFLPPFLSLWLIIVAPILLE